MSISVERGSPHRADRTANFALARWGCTKEIADAQISGPSSRLDQHAEISS